MTLSLEEVLSGWRELGLPFTEQPRFEKSFTQGLNNQSFLIVADDKKWVLRLNKSDPPHGVERYRENAIHRAAIVAGIAPQIEYVSEDHRILVTQYVEGETRSPPQMSDGVLRELIAIVQQIANIEISLPQFDYQHYLLSLHANSSLPDEVSTALEILETYAIRGLCHHDLIPGNIIFRADGACVLDWEFAAHGYPVIDWACLVCEWQLEPAQIAKAAAIDDDLLQQACLVYRTMCKWWTEKSLT